MTHAMIAELGDRGIEEINKSVFIRLATAEGTGRNIFIALF